jgi:hypothetical protein
MPSSFATGLTTSARIRVPGWDSPAKTTHRRPWKGHAAVEREQHGLRRPERGGGLTLFWAKVGVQRCSYLPHSLSRFIDTIITCAAAVSRLPQRRSRAYGQRVRECPKAPKVMTVGVPGALCEKWIRFSAPNDAGELPECFSNPGGYRGYALLRMYNRARGEIGRSRQALTALRMYNWLPRIAHGSSPGLHACC